METGPLFPSIDSIIIDIFIISCSIAAVMQEIDDSRLAKGPHLIHQSIATKLSMAKVAEKRARAAQKPPEERRKQLLRAGVACFAQKGIGGTKHADLARACEVSVPAVFSYLPNRDALVT